MSIRQDYLLRLIEQIGQVLVQMLNRILNRPVGEMEEISGELHALAHRFGLDLELIRRLTPESLPLLIAPSGMVEPGRCWLLAELMYLDGLQAERRENVDLARSSYDTESG